MVPEREARMFRMTLTLDTGETLVEIDRSASVLEEILMGLSDRAASRVVKVTLERRTFGFWFVVKVLGR